MQHRLQRGKLRLCLLKVLPLHRKRQVPFLLNPLPALTDFVLYDVIVNPAEPVKPILLIRQQHHLPQICHVLILVIDRDFELAVQRIKELAVTLKNAFLFLLICRCIVNVRKPVAFGIFIHGRIPAPAHLKYPVLRHRHDFNRLLYGFRCPIKRHIRLFQLLKPI